MQTSYLKTLSILFGLLPFIVAPSFAGKKQGGDSGGGGDSSEIKVDEIREDILAWLKKGGGKGLILPDDLSYQEYAHKMINILAPKKVVVTFIEKDDPTDEELQVSVDGFPKTCRGFISKKDSLFHMLCNISRFENASGPEQYKVIHHEYAGLVNIEKNVGAFSDYSISKQITNYLSQQVVFRLEINPIIDEHTAYLPSYLFALYPGPSRFNCYMNSKSLGEQICPIPSVSDLNEIIESYENDYAYRFKRIKDYEEQNSEYSKKLMILANDAENEFGNENSFSKLYRSVVSEIDRVKPKVSSQVILFAGKESPYLAKLKSMRDAVQRSELKDNWYSDYSYRNLFHNFESSLKGLDEKFPPFKIINFATFLNLEKTCEEIPKDDELWQIFSLSYNLNRSKDLSFDPFEDKETLKKLLTSDRNRPVTFNCKEVKNGSSLLPEYNKETHVLTIPYFTKSIEWTVRSGLNLKKQYKHDRNTLFRMIKELL